MEETREALLQAWMDMEIVIRGNRLLRELSVNEMLVCNALVRRQEGGLPPVTATELCEKTRLLKSQINRILTGMERRGLIERKRSEADRRVVYVRIREEALPRYRREHEHVLGILEQIRAALGERETRQLARLMARATAAAARYQDTEAPAANRSI